MSTIKVSRLHHKPFKDFLKSMLLVDESVYFRIDGDKIATSMYTQNRDTAMLRTVELASVMDLPPNTAPVRIGLYKGTAGKLMKYLDNFDQQCTEAVLHTFLHRADNRTYVQKIDLRDPQLHMSVFCMDPGMGFVEMTPEQGAKAFSDPAVLYKFDLSKENLTRLVKLTAFVQEENKLIDLVCDGSKVTASCDLFEMDLGSGAITGTGFSPGKESQLFKKFFDRIPQENYSVSVYKAKALLESADSDVKLAINLAMQA